MNRFQSLAVCLLLALTLIGWPRPAPAADCPHHTVDAVLSMPLSSRISRPGEPVAAVLVQQTAIRPDVLLPPGSRLNGRVLKTAPHQRTGEPGRLMLVFTEALTLNGRTEDITAMAATPDGWLKPDDAGTSAWQPTANRSTRLLNQRIMRRLGSDQAVWGQILGIRGNRIPDPTTDRFMVEYHRHDLLMGAGDRIQLRLGCPGLLERR